MKIKTEHDLNEFYEKHKGFCEKERTKVENSKAKFIDLGTGIFIPRRAYLSALNKAITSYDARITAYNKKHSFRQVDTCVQCDPDVDLDKLINGKYQCQGCKAVFKVQLLAKPEDEYQHYLYERKKQREYGEDEDE